MIPKGLLTFLGSFYKEGTKTTSELWYIASRDKLPEKIFLPSKTTMSSTYNVGFYLRNTTQLVNHTHTHTKTSMASLAVTKTTANELWKSLQGNKLCMPKTPWKVNNPFRTTQQEQTDFDFTVGQCLLSEENSAL